MWRNMLANYELYNIYTHVYNVYTQQMAYMILLVVVRRELRIRIFFPLAFSVCACVCFLSLCCSICIMFPSLFIIQFCYGWCCLLFSVRIWLRIATWTDKDARTVGASVFLSADLYNILKSLVSLQTVRMFLMCVFVCVYVSIVYLFQYILYKYYTYLSWFEDILLFVLLGSLQLFFSIATFALSNL